MNDIGMFVSCVCLGSVLNDSGYPPTTIRFWAIIGLMVVLGFIIKRRNQNV